MSRLIFFIESYTAGGSDQIAKILLDNLESEHIFLILNKNIDNRIILGTPLKESISVHKYNLLTPADIGIYANKFKKDKFPYYIILKLIDYILRYPLLFFSFFYFIMYLKKFKATHFISHNGGYPGGLYCGTATMASFFISSIKYNFYAFHSMPFPIRKHLYLLDILWDRLLDKTSNFISVSKASSEKLSKIRFIKQKPFCIYNGIEPRAIKNYNQSKILNILHVGYFDFNKNQIMLLKCLTLMIKMKKTDIHITFVGDVDDIQAKKEVDSFIENANISKYITFTGFQKNTENYYLSNDILICTSKIESLPLAILEAMRVGMPIISTEVGGVKEQVIEGENGFLVNVNDIENLLLRILEFYENSESIKKMGIKSHQIFNEKFLMKTMIEQYNNKLKLTNL